MSTMRNAASSGVPDYELDEYVAADTPLHLKAIGDDTRKTILDMLLERAATTSQLADALDKPKGTVGYHLKVLEEAGLIRIVRTRQVRAMTEKYYGRVGRTIVFSGPGDGSHMWMLTEALEEAVIDEHAALPMTTIRHARIPDDRAVEFADRVVALSEEFVREERGGDTVYGFVAAVYPTARPSLKDGHVEEDGQ